MSKTKTKEASRVQTTVRSYCQRANCPEWATYHVFDKGMSNIGDYCTRDSEFLVRAINTSPPDIPINFPPL